MQKKIAMKILFRIPLFLLLFSCFVAQSQNAAAPPSTQENFVTNMLNEVGRIVDKANIQITSSTLTESDQTKTLTGNCNFFNLTNVGFTASFDQGGLIRKFEVAVPLGQKLNTENISSIIKSDYWLKLFLHGALKNSMLPSKFSN